MRVTRVTRVMSHENRVIRVEIATGHADSYMRGLLDRYDEPVLLEMEKFASREHFPIVNRHVGVTIEILARAIGARRVFELGSGYGYSAFWFARAVGQGGEVHCTDGDAENAKKAKAFLSRAKLWGMIRFHVGDAVTLLRQISGEWDIVYNDIDKEGYPDAWKVACDHIRIGGFYICDNVLRVGHAPRKLRSQWAEAIREHNEKVASDSRYLSSILPIREGLIMAYRLR
jgi:caffeoyl-CoA O-methyltransferase